MTLTPEREAAIREFAGDWCDPDSDAPEADLFYCLSEIDALRARVAALEEAGDGLAGFDGHPPSCEAGHIIPGPCSCGWAARVARWREVREEK